MVIQTSVNRFEMKYSKDLTSLSSTHLTLMTCRTPVTDGDMMLCKGFPIGATVPRTMAYGTFLSFCAPTYSVRSLSIFNCGASYSFGKFKLVILLQA